MLCSTFGWTWPNGSGEKDFQYRKFYLPLGKSKIALHFLTHLNPLHQRICFVLKLVGCPLIMERKMFTDVVDLFLLFFWVGKRHAPSIDFEPILVEIGHIFVFFFSSHLWKGLGPSLEQTWISFTQGSLCQVWMKLAHWFRRRWKWESLQTYGHTEEQTDKWKDSQTTGN